MRKVGLFVCICAALFTLVNASVWEGAAVAAPDGELAETGHFVATNSFPENTMVDVTNLENGKKVRAVVSSGLDNPGLLAMLSKDAAGAIGLESRTVGRISMTQPPDSIAFSRFTDDGVSAPGDPDFDPAAFVALNGYGSYLAEGAEDTEPGEGEAAGEERVEGGELIVDMPEGEAAPLAAGTSAAVVPLAGEAAAPAADAAVLGEEDVSSSALAGAVSPGDDSIEPAPVPVLAESAAPPADTLPPEGESIEPVPETLPPAAPGTPGSTYALSLVPADSRPPEGEAVIDSDLILPELSPAGKIVAADESSSGYIDPALIVDSTGAASVAARPAAPPPPVNLPEMLPAANAGELSAPVPPTVSAPAINGLERGKYYLQIGAFSEAALAESEISRIDKKLPVAVMNAGSADKPVYRVLIGPVNLGESGALLQRFKVTHKDAFIRLGT